MDMQSGTKKGMLVVGAVILLIIGLSTCRFIKIEGNQAVVSQTVTGGVLDKVWRSGTKAYMPIFKSIYKYDIGTQKCSFAKAKGSDYSSIKVNVGENGGQSAWIDLSVNYRIGWMNKDGLGLTYEDVILKRTIVDVINKISRPRKALNIYSGVGFVTFKNDVKAALIAHPIFVARGVYIENVVVENVYLNKKYETTIEEKQLAIQDRLKKMEETKAAQEEAKRAFALAQAEVEVRRQTAEARKIETVKEAEGKAQQAILAAQADKQKKILDAEGERDANLAQASGILAVGKAEAEVTGLKKEALYGGAAGALRAKVQIAEFTAQKLKGIFEGVNIVPEKTILSIGAGNGLVVDPGSNA